MLRLILVVLATLTALTPGFAGISGRASSNGRPAAGAVVWLDVEGAAPSPPRHALMDQRGLTFIPHVLAVRLGTIVDFPNHDRVFHNVFSYHNGRKFDLGLYPFGYTRHVPFDRLGLSRLFCNIHPQMAAYIMVLNTSCFAVSDPGGHFELPAVLPGRYTYHAWKPGSDEIKGLIDVEPGKALEVKWTR